MADIDPREQFELYRIEDRDKGINRYEFRSYEQIKVDGYMRRVCYQIHRKDENEAWVALKERLEESLNKSVDEL